MATLAAPSFTERSRGLSRPSKRMKFIGGDPTKSATNMVAGRSYISCGAPICSTTPWFITAIWSAIDMASSWSCVTYMVVAPIRSCRSRSSSVIVRLSSASSAPSGSSIRKAFGPAHDGPAERDALAVAAGQTGHLARKQVLDAQKPRRLAHLFARFVARRALALQRKADVRLDVHVRIESEELEDESDVPLGGAKEGHVLAVQKDAAFARQFEAGDHPQGRRLAAARRPQHDKEGALIDGEGRAIDGDEIAKSLAQLLDADLSHERASFGEMADNDEAERPGQDRDERVRHRGRARTAASASRCQAR